MACTALWQASVAANTGSHSPSIAASVFPLLVIVHALAIQVLTGLWIAFVVVGALIGLDGLL
jgi:hypothetical protein